MDDWEKYCRISKNARAILSSLDPVLDVPENPAKTSVAWEDSFKSQLAGFCRSLDSKYSESLLLNEIINKLNTNKEGIVKASKVINEQCSKLLKDREHLVSLNSAVQSKYFYYSHLENLESQVIWLKRDPTNLLRKFLEIYAQIEDAIDFFKRNPHYIESNYYRSEYENLWDSWTSSLVGTLSESFTVFYAYYDNYFKTLANSDEISKIFKQLFFYPGVSSDPAYVTASLTSTYFKTRAKHVKTVTAEGLSIMEAEKSVNKQSEIACELLNQFWKKELKLFAYYFSDAFPTDELRTYFLSFTDPFYEVIRENLIQEHGLEELAQLSMLLKSYSEQSKVQIFSKLYEDVQERIVYEVTLYMNESIVAGVSENAVHPASAKTLWLLKMLHLKINEEVFDSIAGEAIDLCIDSLKKSTPNDFVEAHVFLIKNLLHLRKEIHSLGATFKSFHYKQLDFTDTKRLFWKLIMGDVSLQKKGVFTELVQSGVPKFSQKNQNDLENEFETVCQSFVLKIFHEIANPIMVFLVKTKEISNLSYDQAKKALEDSTNRINSIFPRFKSSIVEVLDDKNYQEMTESVKSQVLKAFTQHISYMEKEYQGMALPSINDIESLL